MGFLDRLFGGSDDRAAQPVPQAPNASPQRQLSEDERAIERYRYLLRTAPPETIEQVHAEAFAQLTPEQRRQVYEALSAQAGPGDQLTSDDPNSLARAATRQEVRQPGSMERTFAGAGGGGGRPGFGGPSFGSMLGASMLGTIAGVVVGSAIASAFLPDAGSDVAADGGADAGGDAGGGDAGAESGGDAGGDAGGGGDWGGSGGDWGGGGDFGGGGFGDFGGGFDGGGF